MLRTVTMEIFYRSQSRALVDSVVSLLALLLALTILLMVSIATDPGANVENTNTADNLILPDHLVLLVLVVVHLRRLGELPVSRG